MWTLAGRVKEPNDKFSILHLTAGSDAGGLSRYIHDISCAMREMGHRVVIAGERGAWHWLFEKSGLEWVDVPLKGGPLKLFRAARVLSDYLGKRPVDLIHTHYRRPTLVARRLQDMRRRPPILYTLHLSHLSLSPWRRPFSDFGDHSHVASVEALEWLRDEARVPAERITLLAHGVDVVKYAEAKPQDRAMARRSLGLGETDVVAAYVGRLDYPKNEDWLLDIAAGWQGRTPRLRVLLAGEGPNEGLLKKRIAAEGLQNKVSLLGHRDPLAVYQAADLVLLPSLREGFSLVNAEAMAVGTPMLRTRTAGTKGLIVEGQTGWSTEIVRGEFVGKALAVLGDPARLAEMRGACAGHVRREFSYARQVEGTLGMYRRVIAGGGRAR